MLGTLLGPYRVEAELGSGGMGTVYRARVEGPAPGLEQGQTVALKVVHPHLLARASFFQRFLREGEVGRRIDHENVVRTYDIGSAEVDRQRTFFLAMEYVEGQTLRALLRGLGRVPERLLREIGRQVAAGLSAIHDAGIVHRDLKPENVLLTADHRVRIMDMGVARLVEQSVALTEEGHFAGSVLYAAPEQFHRGDVGPPADLYAMGVMLYELATGVHPFESEDMAAVIGGHLDVVPLPASDPNPEVSPFFSEVIDALLAKDSSRRPPSAAFLRQLLEDGERSTWWAERERDRIAAGPRRPAIPVARQTVLCGRAIEREVLRDAWERARRGEGNTVLLEGEAGIGKTRLVDAFLSDLEGDAGHVLYGAYLPSGGPGALSEAILAHFGTLGLEDALRPYLDVAPALVPGFASIVKHECPPAGAQALEGDALHAMTVHLVRGLAAEGPVLWVIEDLHFASDDSRRVAVSLARALAGHRVLLVLTARPGLPEDDLAHLGRLENMRRVRLGRLSPRDVTDLLMDTFRSETLADRLGGKIAYKSDGVPFFIFEMIRGLKDGGFLRESSDGTYVETRPIEQIDVPSAVWDLVKARMKDLDREERAILDVGAVQGFAFDATLVADVLERRRIPVLQTLAELERQSGIVRDAGRLTRFDHHQVQEVLYQSLPEALRVEYHAALADALAARIAASSPKDVDEESGVFLATHHLSGNRPGDGLPFLDRALDHLAESYRNDAVVGLVDRALAAPGLVEGERRMDLLLRKAQQLKYAGRREAERSVLEDAFRLAEQLGKPAPLARALGRYGSHLLRTASYEESEGILRRARELARRAGDDGTDCMAVRDLGVVASEQARYDEARVHFEEALVLARAHGDRRVEASATGGLGNVHRAQGRLDEARRHHERHLELAREVGDPHVELIALGNLANMLTYEGRYDGAEERFAEALTLARAIGDRYAEGTITGNLGGLLHTQGRYADARERYERALVLTREVGNRRGEANVVLNLGSLRQQLGDPVGAQQAIESSLAISRETGLRRLEGHALRTLADLATLRGDIVTAQRRLEQARCLFEEASHAVGVLDAQIEEGRLLAKCGDLDAARVLWEEVALRAEDAGFEHMLLTARCLLAGDAGGDVETARRLLAERSQPSSLTTRLEVCWLLWKATGEAPWLEEAAHLLERLRGGAPEEYRETMIQYVPLYREIHEAWDANRRTASPSSSPADPLGETRRLHEPGGEPGRMAAPGPGA